MTSTIAEEKSLLRSIYKRDRQNLSLSYKKQSEETIYARFLAYLQSNKPKSVIGFYYPTRDELNTIPLLEKLEHNGTTCLLPKISPKTSKMEFYEWTSNSKMKKNTSFIFLEPCSNRKKTPNIIITPLLTCDITGNRLGYGKGFYDQYISSHNNMIKIGFCYEELLSKEVLPSENHDQKIDIIFTENRTIYIS
ncbi:MAG: 5-formyltetrahydrofolate cyclo-ligase [Alphaproteobacteria bacterium]|nr:5-formyltetrahydrofolate cyclo-ligase [Alphaproteobacteria bacterium]